MKFKLPRINLKKNSKSVKFITIDGITCSGKSKLSRLMLQNLKKKNNAFILSKDLFLRTRQRRVAITKKITKNLTNQNNLHYDLDKLKILIKFFINPGKKRSIKLIKLYNRKNGKNDLTVIFKHKLNTLILFEGIYVNDDLKRLIKPIIKILVIETIYNSLSRKIERIRDKKISIQNVIKEFTKIHLFSYKKYLEKHKYDLDFKFQSQKFIRMRNGKTRQINLIQKFLSKHSF